MPVRSIAVSLIGEIFIKDLGEICAAVVMILHGPKVGLGVGVMVKNESDGEVVHWHTGIILI